MRLARDAKYFEAENDRNIGGRGRWRKVAEKREEGAGG